MTAPPVRELLERSHRLGADRRNTNWAAALGTSCPDHFLRTKVRPMVLDLPPDAPLEHAVERLRGLHAAYREDYQAYDRRPGRWPGGSRW